MTIDTIDALKDVFTHFWVDLSSTTVPGTENLSWLTVIIAPFGFAVFVFALNKVLNMSATQGIGSIARNEYKKYQKGKSDE